MLLNLEDLEKLVEQIEEANLIEEKDPNRALNIYLNLWEKLPEPKEKQPEQISNWLIDCIYNSYFDIHDFVNAKKWALKGLSNDTAEEGAYEYFQIARVCFELGELEEALKYFSIAYQRGKKRAFKEFDKKYWDFYSKHK